VFVGQNLKPRSDDPLVDVMDGQLVDETLRNIRSVVRNCADAMPLHEDFVRRHCAATEAAL
jgi:tryptophan halogenase